MKLSLTPCETAPRYSLKADGVYTGEEGGVLVADKEADTCVNVSKRKR
jgi:hypothetical protein